MRIKETKKDDDEVRVLHKKCPNCGSNNIFSLIDNHYKKAGCMCGFRHPARNPYKCGKCDYDWDNYKPFEFIELPCSNPKCPMGGVEH